MENRQEWLKQRKHYLGGSDLGAICGLNAFKTPLDVYLEKTEGNSEEEINAAMRWGNLLEDAVAKAYAEDTGQIVSIELNVLYHPEYPFLGANIDRWVGDKEFVLECKTAGFNKGKEWGEVGSDQIPESYLVQVAYYAAICNVPKVDIAVLIGGQDFRIYTYERNKDLEEKLIKIAVNFWKNHVEKGIPPKCINTHDTFNLFPTSTHHEIVAEDGIVQKLVELKEVREEESRIQSTIERLKTDIQEFMRDYDILIDEGGAVRATWKNTTPRSLVDVDKLKEMFKDVYEQCLKTGKQSRMFLIK